jgi:hypothetical protein
MSHMSVLGACWVQAYFEEIPNFGKVNPILEKNNWQEKQHVRGKSACKGGKHARVQEGKPNHVRVRVLERDCNN